MKNIVNVIIITAAWSAFMFICIFAPLLIPVIAGIFGMNITIGDFMELGINGIIPQLKKEKANQL